MLTFIQRFPDPYISTEGFVDFDIEISTSHGRLTTADIIAEVTGTQDTELEDKKDDIEEERITKPTTDDRRSVEDCKRP